MMYEESSFVTLAIEELKMLAKTRNIDNYENKSRQESVNIFTTAPTSKPISWPTLNHKKTTFFFSKKARTHLNYNRSWIWKIQNQQEKKKTISRKQ